jgi:hypothetical protein
MVQSSGSHYQQVRYYAGDVAAMPAELAGHDHRSPNAPGVQVPMQVTAALDTAPEFGAALLDFWRSLSPTDRRRPLLLVAHGPQSDADATAWTSSLGRFAAKIAQEGSVTAAVGLLRDDAAPAVRAGAVRTMRESISRMIDQGADSVTVLPVMVVIV